MDDAEFEFLVDFLSKLNIPPINNEYYTELDKNHANAAFIVMIITMILIIIIF
jgi:hypothetical protein